MLQRLESVKRKRKRVSVSLGVPAYHKIQKNDITCNYNWWLVSLFCTAQDLSCLATVSREFCAEFNHFNKEWKFLINNATRLRENWIPFRLLRLPLRELPTTVSISVINALLHRLADREACTQLQKFSGLLGSPRGTLVGVYTRALGVIADTCDTPKGLTLNISDYSEINSDHTISIIANVLGNPVKKYADNFMEAEPYAWIVIASNDTYWAHFPPDALTSPVFLKIIRVVGIPFAMKDSSIIGISPITELGN